MIAAVSREAKLQPTAVGRYPASEGWFVLNAREAVWGGREGLGVCTAITDDGALFPQIGVNIVVLAPGQPIGMYHWEADSEEFLVLEGEGLLLVDGEERPLRRWDFVHTPPGIPHMILGAGERGCIVLAIGAREHQADPARWGAYPVDELARRYGAGASAETSDPDVAYAEHPDGPYRAHEGWLPE